MPQVARVARGSRRRTERLRQPLVRRCRDRRGGVLISGIRILGVDPGSRRAGWAVLSGTPMSPVLTACGGIVLSDRLTFEGRLARLQDEMASVLDTYRPTLAAVETPFHGISARSALQLAHARGVILACIGRASIPVHEYTPATIKKSVTGSGRAEKQQVQLMAARLVGSKRAFDEPDVADAVATALCHLFAQPWTLAVARGMRISPQS